MEERTGELKALNQNLEGLRQKGQAQAGEREKEAQIERLENEI